MSDGDRGAGVGDDSDAAGDAADEERRLFERRGERVDAYVAASVGVVRVAVAGDRVGEFGVARRCDARDVAAGDRLAVATGEDVLAGTEFAPLEFGPAVAVSVDEGAVVAVGPEGDVARRSAGAGAGASADGAADQDAWTACGTLEGVTGTDGALLAAASGVHRVGDGRLDALGLAGARDVTEWGPHAATGDGLYRRAGEEWERVLAGDVRAVAADGAGRAVAATPDALFVCADGTWTERALPAAAAGAPVVDLAVGSTATYGVTGDGTLLVDAGDGWRGHALGLPDLRGLAVRP